MADASWKDGILLKVNLIFSLRLCLTTVLDG
jgi:hypothetical protein